MVGHIDFDKNVCNLIAHVWNGGRSPQWFAKCGLFASAATGKCGCVVYLRCRASGRAFTRSRLFPHHSALVSPGGALFRDAAGVGKLLKIRRLSTSYCITCKKKIINKGSFYDAKYLPGILLSDIYPSCEEFRK